MAATSELPLVPGLCGRSSWSADRDWDHSPGIQTVGHHGGSQKVSYQFLTGKDFLKICVWFTCTVTHVECNKLWKMNFVSDVGLPSVKNIKKTTNNLERK